MENNNNKFLSNFIIETEEMLKELNEKTTVLETSPEDISTIDSIFRVVHTIKGNASFFALTNVKTVAHNLEDILALARTKDIKLSRDFIDLLWKGVSFISKSISLIKDNKSADALTGEENELIRCLSAKLEEYKKAKDEAGPKYRETDNVRYLSGNADISRPVFVLEAFINKCKEGVFEPERIPKFISTLSELAVVFDGNGEKNNAKTVLKMASDYEMLVDDTGRPNEYLLGLLSEGLVNILKSIKRVDVSKPKAEEGIERSKPGFRIEEGKIDEVLGSVRKLDDVKTSFGIVRNKLMGRNIPGEVIMEFQKVLNALNFLSRDIRQMLIRIKVTSPELLFEKTERMIMSLAHSSNKKIRIETKGKDVAIDRGKLEVLESILLHIVRNSIDHGIEVPEERLRAGKPEDGLITVEANKTESGIDITISDDGKGIDFEAVKEAAFKNGKVTLEEKSKMTDEEATKLLFLPGVTTSKVVTEISGRGVGLDVVIKKLEEVQGSIRVNAELGKGTRFVISLPNDAKK